MFVAVEGCCHGELDKIYDTISYTEQQNNIKIDLLLICGDFQAVRNKSDLSSMAVLPKYQKMNTFYKYYSGEKLAPLTTIFIGGNHEASNYMQELPYGGWVAPNIYYMGYAGVVQFGGIRIGGLSGIYKYQDFLKGHFELPPYNESTKRSVYHVRNLEIFRIKQLQQPLDVFLSHDWPQEIYHYGNVNKLLQKKRFFADEISTNSLGSPAAKELLHYLKPAYWFSAHLHVKFPAVVDFTTENGPAKVTKFLALDKCLPGRDFLQVLEVHPNTDQPKELHLDPEWLCIIRSTNHLLSLGRAYSYMPNPGSSERYDFTATQEELESISKDFNDNFKLPNNFVQTAKPHDGSPSGGRPGESQICINPQTTLLCEMVGLTDPYAVFLGKPSNGDENSMSDAYLDNNDFINNTLETESTVSFNSTFNPDEILLDDDDEKDDDDKGRESPPCKRLSLSPKDEHSSTDQAHLSFNSRQISATETSDQITTDVDAEQGHSVGNDSSAEVAQNVISPTPLSASTPLTQRIMKRRNLSIYATTEEDT